MHDPARVLAVWLRRSSQNASLLAYKSITSASRPDPDQVFAESETKIAIYVHGLGSDTTAPKKVGHPAKHAEQLDGRATV